MNAVTMTETTAQRDAERMREHAPRLLMALQKITHAIAYRNAVLCACADPAMLEFASMKLWEAQDAATEAIEYATGAFDPDCYPEDGYSVDAAGTFGG